MLIRQQGEGFDALGLGANVDHQGFEIVGPQEAVHAPIQVGHRVADDVVHPLAPQVLEGQLIDLVQAALKHGVPGLAREFVRAGTSTSTSPPHSCEWR